LISEFSKKKAESRNWPTGLTWLGRLLWIVPIGCAFIGFCGIVPKKMDSVWDLIEKQHNMEFTNKSKGSDANYNIKGGAPAKDEEQAKPADDVQQQ